MKIYSLALLTLLLVAPWTGSLGTSLRRPDVTCCYKDQFIKRKVPASRIKSYWNTSPLCSHQAVIVVLANGMACVDPKVDWFQKYLKKKKLGKTSM